MSDFNYYEILGVSKNATLDEIKTKYRELSLKFHPDKTNSSLAAEMMKKINEAYETLSDIQKRKNYDQNNSSNNHHTKSKTQSEKKSAKSVWKAQLKEMGKSLYKLWLKFLENQRQNQARNQHTKKNYRQSSQYGNFDNYDNAYDDNYDDLCGHTEPKRPKRNSRKRKVKRTKTSNTNNLMDSWEESFRQDQEFLDRMFGFSNSKKGKNYE